jgi:hypothetical protein
MPSKKELLERLQKEVEAGRGEERAFLGDVKKSQEERIANEKKRTRFTAECGSPETYVSLNKSKDFVIEHVGNVSVAWTILDEAWKRLRDKAVLDAILQEGEKAH